MLILTACGGSGGGSGTDDGSGDGGGEPKNTAPSVSEIIIIDNNGGSLYTRDELSVQYQYSDGQERSRRINRCALAC
ncbi:hypothetical protein ACU6U9_04295 [Pseudomonas sp. HK3]